MREHYVITVTWPGHLDKASYNVLSNFEDLLRIWDPFQ